MTAILRKEAWHALKIWGPEPNLCARSLFRSAPLLYNLEDGFQIYDNFWRLILECPLRLSAKLVSNVETDDDSQ